MPPYSRTIFTKFYFDSPLHFKASASVLFTKLSRPISTMSSHKAAHRRAEDFVDFLNASPTPFHAVKSAAERLQKAGFEAVKERDSWSTLLQPGGKYYTTRNASTIVAFAIGAKWRAGNPVAVVGAHTDSPCLKVKPVSKRTADGYLQVGVECYGGGMWHTWFDRDLSLAGRVMVKSKSGHIEGKLVRVSKPILRIPNLAIHFGVKFEPNTETNLLPVLGLVAAELNRTGSTAEEAAKAEKEAEESAEFSPLKTASQRHHSRLVSLLAEEAGCAPEDIVDLEVVLYDTQPSCIGGLNDEFIFSARLDNLGMTYCAVEGLIQSLASPSALASDATIRLIACFDHEEIGSVSAQGAQSNILPAVIKRLSHLGSNASAEDSDKSFDKLDLNDSPSWDSTAYERTLATSFLISADMEHAVNPNYSSNYESEHKSQMNAGTAIKINANVRYASNSPGIVLLQECARRAKPAVYRAPGSKISDAGVPLQLFVVRNDGRCGSTIGPALSAKLGIRTIDVGNPQLAMHSIRETCGSHDVEHGVNLFDSFFEHYNELESKITVE